jgi:hypothetical protein
MTTVLRSRPVVSDGVARVRECGRGRDVMLDT